MRRIFLASTAIFAALSSQVVRAQDGAAVSDSSGNSQGFGEIIVTAQKRAENVQDVPIAISAISGDSLNEQNITNISALTERLPNIRVSILNGEIRFAIRGVTFEGQVAAGAESRIATHVDGVYLSRSGAIGGVFYDMERVEVLRGPQGTLFGRNAVAGAVNLITRDPGDKAEGYLQATVGNYNSVLLQGAASAPIADGVGLRIAFQTSDHDGYARNITNNVDIDDLKMRGVRAKLKVTSIPGLDLVLSADYALQDDNSGLTFGRYLLANQEPAFGGIVRDPSNRRNALGETVATTYRENYGFSANATLELSDNLSLVSVTGYRKSVYQSDFDGDFTNKAQVSPVKFGERSRQFSQETRLQVNFDRGNAMLGTYYFDDRYTGGVSVAINPQMFGIPLDYLSDGVRYGGRQHNSAYAIFAQGEYELADGFKVVLGARFNHEVRRNSEAYNSFVLVPLDPANLCDQPCNIGRLPAGVPFTSGKVKFDNFSPRITLNYEISPDANIYATYSKGFKSGGYSPGLQLDPFKPEKITDYEVGVKADLADRKLRVNLAGFYYDYTNLQVNQILPNVPSLTIRNAAAAKLYGVEAEFVAIPTDRLRIDFAASLMKSEFTDFLTSDPSRPNGPNGDPTEAFDLSGNRLPSAPKYSMSFGAQYSIPTKIGKFTLRGDGTVISNVFFDEFNNPRMGEGSYALFNAGLNYESNEGGFYGSVFVRNIGNETRFTGGTQGASFQLFPVQVAWTPPRTYGVMAGVRF